MTRVPSVLIVDDDREIRRLVSRFLAENGMRAFAVADAAEAGRALEGGDFDLVVLDVML
ncbi:MAG: response regulator, partial [Alphaproteobacteria bacterium]|nr:response regulator [Alphaproteobacteria bacterium]